MKKAIAILLTLFMLATIVSGCSTDTPGGTPTGTSSTPPSTSTTTSTETKEPGIVKIFGSDPVLETSPEEMAVFKAIEEKLNVKFEWELVAAASYEDILNTKIASGGVDADIFKCGTVSAEMLGSNGTIVKLSDYFDTLLPNVKKVLDNNDYLKASLTSPDGSVWFLPKYYGSGFTEYPMIRQDWLDELGLEMPKTLDDLYNYLKLVKQTDLNKNGQNDEIPWGMGHLQYSWMYTCQWFGIEPVAIWYYIGIDENGKIYNYLASDQFKECMMFLAKCFKEGLINNDLPTITGDNYKAHVLSNKVGFMTAMGSSYTSNWDAQIEASTPGAGAKYVFMMPPDAGYKTTGVRIGGFSSTLHYISSKGKNIEDALRVFDYVFGEEGGVLTWAGFEGETYTVNSDGSLALGPKIKTMDSTEATKYLQNIGALSGGANLPVCVSANTYFFSTLLAEGGDRHIDAINELMSNPKVSQQAEVAFRFTDEETEVLNELQNVMRSYTWEELAKFYFGTRSFDEWEDFCKTVETQYQLGTITDVYAAAYARSAS